MGTTEPAGLKRCPILDGSESSSRYRSSPPIAIDQTNEADDGSHRVNWDFLLAVATKAA